MRARGAFLDTPTGTFFVGSVPNLVGIWDPSADAPSLDATLTRMMNLVDVPAFGYLRTRGHGVGLA